MNETLSKMEQIALHGASEALVIIRKLASAPITPESQKAIRDLADAFHNVPAHCAGPAQQRQANAFLIDAALRHATKACVEHGFTFTPALSATQAGIEVHADKLAVTDSYSEIAGQPAMRVTVIENCPEIPCA